MTYDTASAASTFKYKHVFKLKNYNSSLKNQIKFEIIILLVR